MLDGFFAKPEELFDYPFSTLMKKVWHTYLKIPADHKSRQGK